METVSSVPVNKTVGSGGGVGGDRGVATRKKESIVDLTKYMGKMVRVKFQGGREAVGILNGFDPLLNIVLDNTKEFIRDPDDQLKLSEETRDLGLVVCKGPSVVVICPLDGMEQIANPFVSSG